MGAKQACMIDRSGSGGWWGVSSGLDALYHYHPIIVVIYALAIRRKNTRPRPRYDHSGRPQPATAAG
jgi:hypothetical protein